MAVDKRLTDVKRNKSETLSDVEEGYRDFQGEYDDVYDKQIQAERDWLEEQKKYQQEQSDLSIHQMEYEKGQVTKDYQKEQSAAYVDYQKGINPYGANAEQRAAAGLTNSGYGESSQVRTYTAYQNRVAVARESYQAAVHSYNIAIEQAKLQNSYVLAEIAYKALQMETELSLQKVVRDQELFINKINTELQAENMYHGQYMDVLQQINAENAQEEQKRQFNQTMAFNREQFNWQKAQANKSSSSGGSSRGSSSRTSSKKSSNKSSSSSKSSINKNTQTTKKTSNKSSEPTVDMSSVLALGYGPISASKLNSLVASGKVKETEKNGKLYYTKVFNY